MKTSGSKGGKTSGYVSQEQKQGFPYVFFENWKALILLSIRLFTANSRYRDTYSKNNLLSKKLSFPGCLSIRAETSRKAHSDLRTIRRTNSSLSLCKDEYGFRPICNQV